MKRHIKVREKSEIFVQPTMEVEVVSQKFLDQEGVADSNTLLDGILAMQRIGWADQHVGINEDLPFSSMCCLVESCDEILETSIARDRRLSRFRELYGDVHSLRTALAQVLRIGDTFDVSLLDTEVAQVPITALLFTVLEIMKPAYKTIHDNTVDNCHTVGLESMLVKIPAGEVTIAEAVEVHVTPSVRKYLVQIRDDIRRVMTRPNQLMCSFHNQAYKILRRLDADVSLTATEIRATALILGDVVAQAWCTQAWENPAYSHKKELFYAMFGTPSLQQYACKMVEESPDIVPAQTLEMLRDNCIFSGSETSHVM